MRLAQPRMRLLQELAAFVSFLVQPRVSPRRTRRPGGSGWWSDWFPGLRFSRVIQWAALLWAVNLLFLGPIAVYAAMKGGAVHKLDIQHLPWLQALFWAPVVEELVFRYGLRRPGQALWVVPVGAVALIKGAGPIGIMLVILILALCWWPFLRSGPHPRPLPWAWRRAYLRWFPAVFHLSCLVFAGVHLTNFSLHQTSWLLMPLLVLPQWLTGMVLGWMRVQRGIGASMLLHGVFNGGPLLLVWLVLQTAPELAA